MRNAILAIAIALATTEPALSFEAGTPEFKKQYFNVNWTRNARSLGDEMKKAMRSDEAKNALAGLAAAYAFIPPEVTRDVLDDASTTLFAPDGEIRKLDLHMPEGFMPCIVNVEIMSEVGRGYQSLRLYTHRIQHYTQLAKKPLLVGGRSWVHLKVSVISIYWRDYRNYGDNERGIIPDGRTAYERGFCDYEIPRSHNVDGPLILERRFDN